MTEKGYYYLKLKENFFDSEEMKVLESMENGYLYSNILLKLYLKALKNNGKLTFNDYIPYNLKMLSTIVGHNVDIVDKAIKVFQSMHLIEILDNGIIYMLDMQKMIGSISSEGVRKAEYRERIKAEQTLLGQCPNIIYNSVSNSISNSSNNIEERVVGEEEKPKKPKKKKEFVPPTLEEVVAYATVRGSSVDPNSFYEFFNEGKWIDSNGKPVSNWKQKFLTWESHSKTRPRKQEVQSQYKNEDIERYRR
jgi:predicted phage replisome organizer